MYGMVKHRFSLFKAGKLGKLLLIINIFLCSCSEGTSDPEPKQIGSDQVNAFLETFLFQEGAAYTLFGDKPMTSLLIFTGTAKDISLEYLTPESREKVIYIDDKNLGNWTAWKSYLKDQKFKNFYFVEKVCERDPSCTLYFLVNIPKTIEVCEKCNLSMDHLKGELDNQNSEFWRRFETDHYFAGLLYGFGEENVRGFLEDPTKLVVSEEFNDHATKNEFPIPIYARLKEDQTSRKYQKQREVIKEKYRDRTILEVTFSQLSDLNSPSKY